MILPFDELNNLRTEIERRFTIVETTDGEPPRERIRSEKDLYDIIDMMLDLFLLAYEKGVDEVNRQFGTDFRPTLDEIESTIDKPIKGATWVDRMWAWYKADGTVEDIMRIAETEAHRDGNTAADTTAKKAGATTKTWLTMEDDKVRDTHFYLQSVTVGIDDRFYAYDGDSALFPGDFMDASNNANCRCEIRYA